MIIDTLVLGDYETNCYVLRESKNSKDCLIIDTGLDAGPLIEFLDEHKLNPLAVVLTHGHVDHITGLADLKKLYPEIEVYIHKDDAGMLTDAVDNLSFMAVRHSSQTRPTILSMSRKLSIVQV